MNNIFRKLSKLFECSSSQLITSKSIFSLHNNSEFLDRASGLESNKHCQLCPKCASKDIIKYGKCNKKQRYLCKSCGKTFNLSTFTPLYWTHYPEKWPLFIECMIKGFSLRHCSKILKISYVTLFYWRHKVLLSLKRIENATTFKGIVEISDMYFPYSEKGKKNISDRIPHKTGSRKFFYDSEKKVCIITSMDKHSNLVSASICLDNHYYIPANELDKIIGKYLTCKNILCTKDARYYRWYAKIKNLKQYAITKKTATNKHNILNVKYYNECFSLWLNRFRGIATKYLDNYLGWFRYLYTIDFKDSRKNIKDMLVKSCSYNINVNWNSLIEEKAAAF